MAGERGRWIRGAVIFSAGTLTLVLYMIALRRDYPLVWLVVGAVGTFLTWALYMRKEQGRFPRRAFLAVATALLYGMWALNGLQYGFGPGWFAMAVFGWPLAVSFLYLGQEGARKALSKPQGVLLLSLSVTGGMLVFLYQKFGPASLILLLYPLLAWLSARRRAVT